MNRTINKLVAMLAMCILLVTGCTAPSGQESPQSSSTLVYGVGVDAKTMDPQMVDNVPTANVVMHVHETLVTWDKDMNMTGQLAEDWEVSEDGKTWTFYLREGVKFHDGADFNAEAVEKTIRRMLDPATGSPRRSMLAMISDVKVVDNYTIQLITDEPFGPFLAQLATYNAAMLSPKAIDEYGNDYGQHPAGTGPYKLSEWQPSEQLVLERNEDYWGQEPSTEKLIFKVIPEDTTRVMALKTGEVDIISNVPPFQIEQLETDKNVEVILTEGFRTIYLGMNVQRPPFDDIRVRKAINYAIDRDSIIKNILLDTATKAIGPENPVIPGASADLPTYDYNPEKAKELLAEAGYADGLEIVFHAPFGRYLMDKQVAEAVQAQLAQVGINAKLQHLDWSIYSSMLHEGKESQLFLLGKGSPSGDPDLTMSLSFGTGGGMNDTFFSDEKADELIAKQRVTVDLEERYQILHELQVRVQELAPWAPLYYENQIVAKRANVTGEFVWPNEFVDLRFASKQ